MQEGLRVLDENFSYNESSIPVATKIHRVIKGVTKNPDPYRKMKDEEIRISRQLYEEISPHYGCDLKGRLILSVLGNTIDFFKDFDIVKKDLRRPIDFMVDDADKFMRKLKAGGKVLYLADNAGEAFFDLPLVRRMQEFAKVTYVVKSSPVQNDVTLEDLRRAGLDKELEPVITTGTDTPGVDFPSASIEFKREFEAADLVLAKGMGYYETLSELPPEGKVFHCLMAKCQPVADSLGVPPNSYVALLR
jgi:hypothetical protein